MAPSEESLESTARSLRITLALQALFCVAAVAVQTLCFRWYNLVAAVLGLLLAAACWQGLQQRRQWVLRVFTFGQAVCAVLVVVGLGFLLHAVSNYGRQPGYCSRRGVYVVAAAIGPVLVVLYLFGAIYSIRASNLVHHLSSGVSYSSVAEPHEPADTRYEPPQSCRKLVFSAFESRNLRAKLAIRHRTSKMAALREAEITNAVSFLGHPKVVGSPASKKAAFLESKGLTAAEIAEAFRRAAPESEEARLAAAAARDGKTVSTALEGLQPAAAPPAQPAAAAAPPAAPRVPALPPPAAPPPTYPYAPGAVAPVYVMQQQPPPPPPPRGRGSVWSWLPVLGIGVGAGYLLTRAVAWLNSAPEPAAAGPAAAAAAAAAPARGSAITPPPLQSQLGASPQSVLGFAGEVDGPPRVRRQRSGALVRTLSEEEEDDEEEAAAAEKEDGYDFGGGERRGSRSLRRRSSRSGRGGGGGSGDDLAGVGGSGSSSSGELGKSMYALQVRVGDALDVFKQQFRQSGEQMRELQRALESTTSRLADLQAEVATLRDASRVSPRRAERDGMPLSQVAAAAASSASPFSPPQLSPEVEQAQLAARKRTVELALEALVHKNNASAALASELQGALSQISMYLKNILEHLSEAKYRRISMLNARYNRCIRGVSGAEALLFAAGFLSSGEHIVWSPTGGGADEHGDPAPARVELLQHCKALVDAALRANQRPPLQRASTAPQSGSDSERPPSAEQPQPQPQPQPLDTQPQLLSAAPAAGGGGAGALLAAAANVNTQQ